MGAGIFKNKVWLKPCAFWRQFLTKYVPKKAFRDTVRDPFRRLTYESGGFWREMFSDAPLGHSYDNKPIYGEFLKRFYGIKDYTESQLKAYPDAKFYVPKLSDAEWAKKRSELMDKKNLMGVSYSLSRLGKLVEKGWSVILADCPFEVYVDEAKKPYWTKARTERMILVSPKGDGWEMGALFDNDYPYPVYGGFAFKHVVKKDGKWELEDEGEEDEHPAFVMEIGHAGNDDDAVEAYKMADGADVDVDKETYIQLTDGSEEASVIMAYMKKARAEADAVGKALAKKKAPK